MSFEILTCCLSRAYTAMQKANNTRLYAVHVQPLHAPLSSQGSKDTVNNKMPFDQTRKLDTFQYYLNGTTQQLLHTGEYSIREVTENNPNWK